MQSKGTFLTINHLMKVMIFFSVGENKKNFAMVELVGLKITIAKF
jgi:hypothetical protein